MDFTILEFKHFVAPSAKTTIKRIVSDYEFDFYIRGGRVITTDDHENVINAGDVSIRKPGQCVCSIGDYDCYILTLDLSCTKNRLNYSRNALNDIQSISSDSLVCFLPDKVTPCLVEDYALLCKKLSFSPDLDSEYSKNTVRQFLHMLNIDALKGISKGLVITESAEERVYKYINDNFRNKIDLRSLSDLVHMDPSYLSRIFKKRYGVSPIGFVIRLRLEYASGLIANTDMTVAQIADYCGYGNISFFISEYRKLYGLTPNEHRKHLRNN